MDLSVLRAIHNLVQEKASRLHMWKGKKKTIKGKIYWKSIYEVSKVFNGDKVPLSPIVISTHMKS